MICSNSGIRVLFFTLIHFCVIIIQKNVHTSETLIIHDRNSQDLIYSIFLYSNLVNSCFIMKLSCSIWWIYLFRHCFFFVLCWYSFHENFKLFPFVMKKKYAHNKNMLTYWHKTTDLSCTLMFWFACGPKARWWYEHLFNLNEFIFIQWIQSVHHANIQSIDWLSIFMKSNKFDFYTLN